MVGQTTMNSDKADIPPMGPIEDTRLRGPRGSGVMAERTERTGAWLAEHPQPLRPRQQQLESQPPGTGGEGG
jgi:hypothetical protein